MASPAAMAASSDKVKAALTSEIRKLKANHVAKLGQILSVQQDWKNLMGSIREDPAIPDSPYKFTSEHVRLLSDEAERSGKTGFEVMVDEWGTMGRNRPKIWYLLQLCFEIKAIRAVSYITENILMIGQLSDENRQSVEEMAQPQEEETARNGVRNFDNFSGWDSAIEEDLLGLDSNLEREDDSGLLTHPGPHENAFPVPNVPYNYLASITANFGAADQTRLIGSGGFADVYLGVTLRSKQELAVKKLKDLDHDLEQHNNMMLNFEVGELTRLKHPAIIEILAYSNDRPPHACLIYPYMRNGNLEDRLQMRPHRTLGEVTCLTVTQRMTCIVRVAEGILFLHSQPKPLIHRDIKTSNILLDNNLLPKIADFGLLRHASKENTETINIKGTPRYMAPEAIRGDINVKIDVFSFGAVIIEVLTGLPSFDKDREDRDIITHVQEHLKGTRNAEQKKSKVLSLLDSKVTWPSDPAFDLFELALACLQEKPTRPHIKEVSEKLSQIQDSMA